MWQAGEVTKREYTERERKKRANMVRNKAINKNRLRVDDIISKLLVIIFSSFGRIPEICGDNIVSNPFSINKLLMDLIFSVDLEFDHKKKPCSIVLLIVNDWLNNINEMLSKSAIIDNSNESDLTELIFGGISNLPVTLSVSE